MRTTFPPGMTVAELAAVATERRLVLLAKFHELRDRGTALLAALRDVDDGEDAEGVLDELRKLNERVRENSKALNELTDALLDALRTRMPQSEGGNRP